MKLKNIFTIYVIFFLGTGILFSANAKKVIKKFQKVYEKAEYIEVLYEETASFFLANTVQKENGHLIMARNNNFKLSTDSQVMAADGESFYRLNKINNQLIIDYLKKSDEVLFFQKMFFSITDHFYLNMVDERKIDGQKIYIIKLTPKEDSERLFKEIKIWLTDKSYFIPKMEIIDINDNKTSYRILKINKYKKFGKDDFRIEPAENTEVIDLRL